MKTRYKFIHFKPFIQSENRPDSWTCCNNKFNDLLGIVDWHDRWKRFCFFPERMTHFDGACLGDIIHFIDQISKPDDERKHVKLKDQAFYIDMLNSEECLCGRKKKPRNTFCYLCYKALPPELQKALYQRMGDGYEEAVDEACKHLQQEVW